MKIYTQIVKCRFCQSKKMKVILAFSKSGIDGIYNKIFKAPLTLVKCQNCGQLQLKEIVNPALYKDYNFTGENIVVIQDWCKELANKVQKDLPSKSNKILEIGSGDGYFSSLLKKNNDVLCIEPSDKLSSYAQKKFKLNVLRGYFSSSMDFPHKFDVIIARHVLEHIQHVGDFVKSIIKNTNEDGLIVIEVPDIEEILAQKNYLNFFHEHINYFSVSNIAKLFKPYNFYPTKLFKSKVHGGAFCLFFRQKSSRKIKVRDNITSASLEEFSNGFKKYKKKLMSIKEKMKDYKLVCGYGAANKTFKILSSANLSNKNILCIFDKNKNLHNKNISQFKIPIKSPKEVKKINPDLIIIFATSYEDEIIKELFLKHHYRNDIMTISNQIKILSEEVFRSSHRYRE